MFGGSITFEYMNPNENYWFYLTDNGPDGGPALLFVPVREDVDGAQFQKMIMRLRLSDPDFRTEFKGTARCSAQGRLVLTSSENGPLSVEVFDTFVQQHPHLQEALADTTLVRTEKGQFAEVFLARQPRPSPAHVLVQALATLQHHGDVACFWFDGTHLCLDENPQQLAQRRSALGLEAQGPATEGTLYLDISGLFEFRLTTPHPTLLSELEDFLDANLADSPSLYRLAGAYATVRDNDGNILHIYS